LDYYYPPANIISSSNCDGFLWATVYQIEPAPQAIERVQIGSLKVLDQGQRGCQDKRCIIP